MTHCKNCVHWIDESLAEIAAKGDGESHIFMGCKIFGEIENIEARRGCPRFVADQNLYVICDTCKITVPKVCISLGECVNCTDTDLFCVESCSGGDARKYCTHFVRLHTDGMQLIDTDTKEIYDLFPNVDIPGVSSMSINEQPDSTSAAGEPIPISIRSKPRR